MLEGLFGEDAEFLAAETAMNEGSGDKLPAPPARRPACGLSGIKNQGATCYLNSLLQTLLYTPEFRESLFQLGPGDLGELKDKDSPEAKVRVIPIQLQRLFSRLLLLDQQSASTADLTDSFGWTNNEELQQHDVQELNRILFSAVESSLVGTAGQDLISKLYHGAIVNQIICQECGRVSEREEDFLDLTLPVAGFQGLEDALNSFYNEMELMSGNNQYRCEVCRKLVDAKKGAKLRALPTVLTISLLRFSYDFVKYERYKETGKFTFPMEIDMAPFCESIASGGDTQYELFSVVIHRGSGYGGHYQAYIRDLDCLGNWSSPEEEPIQMTTNSSSGRVDYIELGSADEVLAAVLVQEGGPTHTLTLDKLCQALISQTGVSWNKRFKKHCGPISKFLRQHNETFDFDSVTNLVTLKTAHKSSSKSTNTLSTEMQCEDMDTSVEHHNGPEGSPKRLKENPPEVTENDECRKKTKPKREPSPPPPDGHCWFDFNDSRVHPIKTKDLQKQFSGKQSAYMLFYRRKSLKRPMEAKKQRAYKISETLLEEIMIENAVLEAEREKYDQAVNTIDVKLLQSENYHVVSGAINVKYNSDTSIIALSIDRRKAVADLKTMIAEVVCSDKLNQDTCLHIAKETPIGLHLYDYISGDNNKSIQDAGVCNDSQIFMWNGQEVDGVCVIPGKSSEPVLLCITYNASTGAPDELNRAFPRDCTIGELKVILCDVTAIPMVDLVLSHVNIKSIVLSRHDDGKTLDELKFDNGEKLTAENRRKLVGSAVRLAEMEAERHSKMVSFIVENRCYQRNNYVENYPVIPIEISKDESVETLKATILSRLGLINDRKTDGKGRLRVDDDNVGLKPPLHEKQSIAAAGLTQGLRLVIEPGAPPKTNEITLTFTPGDPSSKNPDMEIMVDKKISVDKCLKLMLEKAGLEGNAWHMRKTNWCGEAADVMDDPDLTLDQEHIKNGDHMLILEGKLPPRGFIRLPIYLYKSPEQGENSVGVLSWISASIARLMSGSASSTTDGGNSTNQPVQIGEIEISKDATLEDLKMQVLTLPQMMEISVPTINFLRLRVIENHNPTRILRNMDQTLKRHKLTNGNMLCVQVLPQEENLSQNFVVLNICKRIPDTRNYTAEEELMWDTSKGATPLYLKQMIADRLVLPVEHIKIAKHIREKYEWLVIQDVASNPHAGKGRQTRGKKKGGSGPKINLRQAPYYLKDGDTIGIKALQFESAKLDDFSTAEDDLGKDRLRQEAEDRKKRRKENRARNEDINSGGDKDGGKKKNKKPEVGIRIHVGDFG
ncbi:ubiquitin carboxyl-terminal hydrolase 40-like [Glandiceps talaboti]